VPDRPRGERGTVLDCCASWGDRFMARHERTFAIGLRGLKASTV
jgi:hypothetical protein